MGGYEKGLQKVKVEINLRKFPNEYEIKDFRGYSVLVMKPEFMFAHKLCAVLDRKNLQNRDLYDMWFMFEKNFSINKDIVKLRSGKELKEYFKDLLKLVDSLPEDYDILSGLGEVLSRSKKDWSLSSYYKFDKNKILTALDALVNHSLIKCNLKVAFLQGLGLPESIGGRDLIDPAWGGYIGYAPEID